MHVSSSFPNRVLVHLVVVLLTFAAALLAAVPNVSAQANARMFQRTPGKLSARLSQLAQPALRTQNAASQARAIGLPVSGPASVVRDAQDGVLAYIRVASTDNPTLAALTAAGARITHVADEYHTVTAFVDADALGSVAALRAVAHVREALAPHIGRGAQSTRARAPRQASCPSGGVSEGDQQLNADLLRRAFNLNGAGITIGVLSDSFDRSQYTTISAQDDILSGDLPGAGNPCGFTTPVRVLKDASPNSGNAPTDEGRAMLQIVHDLAPASELMFVTANGGVFAFADAIRALKQADAQVIVDDIAYLVEPFYQDGPVSVAIQEVTAQGALYVTAAGNDHITDAAGNPSGSYEAAAYRPTTCPRIAITPAPADCHSFNPSGSDNTLGITLAPGAQFTAIFQWAEPWEGVTTDLDVYLLSQSGETLEGSYEINSGSNGTQQPFELLSFTNGTGRAGTFNLVIARAEGDSTPRLKTILSYSGVELGVEYAAANNADTFGPTIYGHAHERSALSVAAVPFDDATTPEDFTSYGPGTVLFGPVRDATPAARLATPETRNKPDLAATDGGQTTFFYERSAGVYRFFGTSAAAPHVAAVGALLLQHYARTGRAIGANSITPLLQQSAAPVVNGVPENVGAGLVDALQAGYQLDALRPVLMLPLVVR